MAILTNETQIKQEITRILKFFGSTSSQRPLSQLAIELFGVLGYHSNEKRYYIEPPTAEGFIADFTSNSDRSFNPTKALVENWEYVDMIFQITGEELKQTNPKLFKLDENSWRKGLYKSFLFFAIELAPQNYTRTQLATITREINKLFQMPVSILFRHGSSITLSIVTHRSHKKDGTRDVLEKVTLIKDINFANPHRAHIEILYDLSVEPLHQKFSFTNFDQLQQAWKQTLDSSELNKRFFREIADWYFWAGTQVAFPPEAGPTDEIRNATGLIRLLTRLIFVWFLKEKNLIPDDLFNRGKVEELLPDLVPEETTYYKAILQNLFFATLNQEMNTPTKPDNRRFRSSRTFQGKNPDQGMNNLYRYESLFKQPDKALALFAAVPFLNGGLFECLDEEIPSGKKKLVDGFSDRGDNPLKLPNLLFFAPEQIVDLSQAYGGTIKRQVRGLINILESYKFTISENTPVEEEIALDPELLGKVFENLLAYYNPETQTTARKQTGSFYTPREIVNYMVDETLIAYLGEKLQSPDGVVPMGGAISNEERLRHLLAFNDEVHKFSEAEVATLILAIDNLKVLDPAAGSGAFPMGMLYRLVYILSRLDPGNARWKQRQLDNVLEKLTTIEDVVYRENAIDSVKQAFEENYDDYGRKLYLIENSIYGVDIQPVAIQIAKLRCFISLIVDQKIDDQRPNKGVRPLPNLETKFVAANSLLGIERPKVETQLRLGEDSILKKEKELADVRHRYFTARTPATKKKYRDQDDGLRAEIGQLLRKDGWEGVTAEKLSRWNPYNQNNVAEFFDPKWMFNLNDGFDIVIGNPPYVRQEAIKEQKPFLAKALPEVYAGTADLYVYFYGRGFQLLREGGHLAYISSNKFFRSDYGKNLRQFFSSKVKLQTVIDFGELPIFEAAADPSIIIGTKGTPHQPHQLATLSVKTLEIVNELVNFIKANASNQLQSSLTVEGWNLSEANTQALLGKIKAAGPHLEKFIGGKFYWGIKTGFNEAFIIDPTTRDRLIAEDAKSIEVIKPYLRGRDVKKYNWQFANLYIIFTRRGINIDNYPAIKNHLSKFKENLAPKTSETQTKGRKAGTYKWYEIQDNLAYFAEFEKPKIIYPDIALHSKFAYDVTGKYLDATLFFIPTDNLWLLALLNSKVAWYFFKSICAVLGDRDKGGRLRLKSIYVGQLPIANPNPEQRAKVERLVNKLIEQGPDAPGAAEWQREIDQVVYEIYGLTEEEIALVEGN
jgi:type I restriction-modification system DNA methylase subunit